MNKLFAILILFLAACADNPLNLTEGQWVKNRLDGQKYYITKVVLENMNDDKTRGYIRVRNAMNVEVNRKFPIHEFEPWVESTPQQPLINNSRLDAALDQLERAHALLDKANTAANRARMEAAIDQVEEAVTVQSPVFARKTWNPVTERYE